MGWGRVLCSGQGPQLGSKKEQGWMVGEEGRMGGEARERTKGRSITSKDITWSIREASPA